MASPALTSTLASVPKCHHLHLSSSGLLHSLVPAPDSVPSSSCPEACGTLEGLPLDRPGSQDTKDTLLLTSPPTKYSRQTGLSRGFLQPCLPGAHVPHSDAQASSPVIWYKVLSSGPWLLPPEGACPLLLSQPGPSCLPTAPHSKSVWSCQPGCGWTRLGTASPRPHWCHAASCLVGGVCPSTSRTERPWVGVAPPYIPLQGSVSLS